MKWKIIKHKQKNIQSEGWSSIGGFLRCVFCFSFCLMRKLSEWNRKISCCSSCSAHCHTSKSENPPSPKRSPPSKWSIRVNNGATWFDQMMPHSLSSLQPWFPHIHEEKGKEKWALWHVLQKKAGQVCRRPPSLSISCLDGRGWGSCTLWPLVPVKASVRNWMAAVDVPVI